eukprot:TRINITY_DN652368_c0_g1_i2.p1 TRINITY_DN652368_c0_g1~~TRINITY_DN652368_c0_g1_i2.p1  ORF type:complete len:434 (-),score=178.86 TRINITY_DN652368_c0_g1_i2:14-1315(-)
MCFSITENSPRTTIVDTIIITDEDEEIPAWYDVTLTIDSGNGEGIFALDPKTGGLTVNDSSKLDFESIKSYALTINAEDGAGGMTSAKLLVSILDENETPTLPIDEELRKFSIAENVDVGTLIEGNINGKDVDDSGTAWGTLSYAVVDDTLPFTTENGQFKVKDAVLDFETKNEYEVLVRVSDGGEPALYAEAVYVIMLTNVNEPPVIEDAERSIIETAIKNQPATFKHNERDTILDPLVATDVDEDTTLMFSFVDGSDLFKIDTCSGLITLKNSDSLDYETTKSYTIPVQVKDEGGLSDTATVVITIIDQNEAPVMLSTSREVEENVVVDTVVGTIITFTDEDTGVSGEPNAELWNQHEFSIVSGDDDNKFKIDNGGQIRVNGDLDYETTPGKKYDLTVRVNDLGGLFAEEKVVVNILNVNEGKHIYLKYYY